MLAEMSSLKNESVDLDRLGRKCSGHETVWLRGDRTNEFPGMDVVALGFSLGQNEYAARIQE